MTKCKAVTLDQLSEAGIPAQDEGKGVFRISTQQGALIFYSTKNLFLFRGRKYNGGLPAAKQFLQSNKLL